MVPEDRLVVLTMRIGLFGWPDGVKGPAGISDRKKLYDVVEGRDVLALVGARSRGRVPRNWRQCTRMASEAGGEGSEPLPFPQIPAGAVSGGWWSGQRTLSGAGWLPRGFAPSPRCTCGKRNYPLTWSRAPILSL